MDSTISQYQFREGDDVLGSDGDKVGSVHSIGSNYLVVEKGFFFPTDYYVPFSAVASYDDADGKVYLNVSKDDALSSGWDAQPGDGDSYSTTMTTDATSTFGSAAGTTTTAMAGSLTADANRIDADYNDDMATRRGAISDDATSTMAAVDTNLTDTAMSGSVDYTGSGRTDLTEGDHITVPVHEEELIATKREREAGEVRVTKNVVSEDRTLEVPITEERVQVTRRVVDRVGDTGETAFREETIEVPLTTQEVDLEKRVRVSEEIDIDREQVQTSQSVTGTVRREVVDVDETTAVETGSRTYTDTDVTTTGRSSGGIIDAPRMRRRASSPAPTTTTRATGSRRLDPRS
jgi:uncharacterized protein (TIGR02271 family)